MEWGALGWKRHERTGQERNEQNEVNERNKQSDMNKKKRQNWKERIAQNESMDWNDCNKESKE